ncbi:hypothetical protein AB0M43_09305 [Longispora sp. NPDC051575]|uniref:hypothetical protein n=1 Tax=Longispora sp. NPDC051575 TaxID=3154943 RepID=UPI003438168B
MTRPFPADQADEALGRLTAEHDRISATLLELDAHPTRRMLDVVVLSGQTARRWTVARAGLDQLWRLYEAYQGVLHHAREVRARRGRPNADDLAELATLLLGRSVWLVGPDVPLGQRSLAGPTAVIEELSLAEAVGRMEQSFATASGLVAAVDFVWTELNPQLTALADRLASTHRLAGDLGSVVDPALERDLEALRANLLADPLAFVTPEGPDRSTLDRLAARVTSTHAGLERAARSRDELETLVERLEAALAELADREADAAREHATAVEKICAPPVPDPPRVTGPLRARLDALRLLGQRGRWALLAEEADRVTEALRVAGAAVAARRAELTGLLDRRTELRGRLAAYRAKAHRLGLAEDAELAGRHEEARVLLWTAPCDLEAAAAAVTRYQRAVLARDYGGTR